MSQVLAAMLSRRHYAAVVWTFLLSTGVADPPNIWCLGVLVPSVSSYCLRTRVTCAGPCMQGIDLGLGAGVCPPM